MFLLDVIMVSADSDDKKYKDQALDSVLTHGVDVIQIDAIDGDTRMARRKGFDLAKSKYVSFVDPDDYVVTDIPIFELCVSELENNTSICGVSTRSYVFREGMDLHPSILNKSTDWSLKRHFNSTSLVHQLTVMRTDLVQKVCVDYHDLIYPIKYNEHMRDLLLAQYGDWKLLPVIGYFWRKRVNSVHKMLIPRPKEMYNEIYKLVTEKRRINGL
jgi:glycosyltransferase involved in cell wall biosynthesis